MGAHATGQFGGDRNDGGFSIITLRRAQVEEMYAHARAARPAECCGLVGGTAFEARTVYPLRNVALEPFVSYEAAPEELFAAQRRMREGGEQLLAIYHSHPRAGEPEPSVRDIRLAFYPSAVYFIIGFREGGAGVLRAFHLDEREGRWARAEFRIMED